MVIKTTKKAITKILPKAIVVLIVGSVVAWILGILTGTVSNMFTGIGEFGILIISVILSLVIFTFAVGMKKKKFDIVTDLIPLLIVAPLAMAILNALNLGIVGLSGSVAIGAELGMTIASLIFANRLVKQMGLFK